MGRVTAAQLLTDYALINGVQVSVCAWCGNAARDAEGRLVTRPDAANPGLSHGICAACKEEVAAKWRAMGVVRELRDVTAPRVAAHLGAKLLPRKSGEGA